MVVFLPIVLVAHKEQGPACMGIVQGSIDFVYVPRQTEIIDIPGKAAHHIIPGEGPDLTTWRVTGKEPGLARIKVFSRRYFLFNTAL